MSDCIRCKRAPGTPLPTVSSDDKVAVCGRCWMDIARWLDERERTYERLGLAERERDHYRRIVLDREANDGLM